MKKKYIVPEIEVIDVAVESILASTAETDEEIVGDKMAGDGTPDLAKQYGGVWEEW